MLLTSATWYTIHLPSTPVVGVMNFLIFIAFVLFVPKIKFTASAVKIVLSLLLIGVWFTIIKGIVFGVYVLVKLLPALYLFLLPLYLKVKLLNFCTKWFSIFLIFSIILYLITQFVILLPPIFGIFKVGEDNFYPPFFNYFFYIRPSYGEQAFRFNGFFLEPGHLAISTIFFLVANKLDFKKTKYMWILLISLILSWSLAGYILLGLSWFMFKTNGIKNIIIAACMGIILMFGAQIWNGGDNMLNNLIFSRLEITDDGEIAGNNRTTERTDNIFEDTLSSGQIITGKSNADDLKITGAGYKKYLIQYGLISAFLMFALYWNLRNPKCNTHYGLCFFILIFLTWCDCEYIVWFTWILPFTLGTGIHLKINNEPRLQKKHI